MEQICEEQGKPVLTFLPEAYEELAKMKWTGNIRELHNVIERLAILCDALITGEDVRRFAQPLME